MTPDQLVLVLLSSLSAVSTVVLAGCLRSLADIRLDLASVQARGASGDALAAGRSLPEFLARELPWIDEDGLILFISGSCPLCAELVSLLPELKIGNIAFGVVDDDSAVLGTVAQAGVTLGTDSVRASADHFEFEYVPVGIHQRNGVIIGSIHTQALISQQEIERFWQHGGARLLEEVAA